MARTLEQCEKEIREIIIWKYDNLDIIDSRDIKKLQPIIDRLTSVMNDLDKHVNRPMIKCLQIRNDMVKEGLINEDLINEDDLK